MPLVLIICTFIILINRAFMQPPQKSGIACPSTRIYSPSRRVQLFRLWRPFVKSSDNPTRQAVVANLSTLRGVDAGWRPCTGWLADWTRFLSINISIQVHVQIPLQIWSHFQCALQTVDCRPAIPSPIQIHTSPVYHAALFLVSLDKARSTPAIYDNKQSDCFLIVNGRS